MLEKNNIKLRLLKPNKIDYKLLEKWYHEKDVYQNFEQRILKYDEIVKKYKSRTSLNSNIPVFMIEYKNKPIGIIQYQLVNEENLQLYGLSNRNIYEIDIFIGEKNMQGIGIGTISINLLSTYLFNKKGATSIIMCPLIKNEKAINCYKKCGFKIKKKFITNDTIGNMQEYNLMIKQNI